MKKAVFFLFASLVLLASAPVFAENINEAYNGSDSKVVATSPNSSDTNTVDLSDKTSDEVQSPSLDNTTPAGQAPGHPIEN